MKTLSNAIIASLTVAFMTIACLSLEAKPSKKAISLKLESHYVETMNPNAPTKNAQSDYGLKQGIKNHTELMQAALDDISKQGGGNLLLPKGTYYFNGVYMRSNVHILVDEGAILKLAAAPASKKNSNRAGGGVIFHFSYSDSEDNAFVENCSIRGVDGKPYTVDYSEFSNDGTSARFIISRMVRNFLIADAQIKDNYTVHCGIIFVPSKGEGADKWELSRPTNGEIRNCSITNANSGYGLCQLHGADGLYFENLKSKGGVTLRLESGAGGPYAGVFDIQARNIYSEYGRAALMMNPHTTHNGTAKIDGVSSVSSSATVMIHGGFIDRKNKDNPHATVGSYANDCEVVNIHGVYGDDAQVDGKEVFICEPRPGLYEKFRDSGYGNDKSLTGPSYAVVYDSTEGDYKVTCRNISGEGFPSHNDCVLYKHEIQDREKKKWDILKALPVMQNRAENSKRK